MSNDSVIRDYRIGIDVAGKGHDPIEGNIQTF
jgi:hypothetical protein